MQASILSCEYEEQKQSPLQRPLHFVMTRPPGSASPCHVCTLWTLALANTKGQAPRAAIICPCVMKKEDSRVLLRTHWQEGGSASLKRTLVLSPRGRLIQCVVCADGTLATRLRAFLESRAEWSFPSWSTWSAAGVTAQVRSPLLRACQSKQAFYTNMYRMCNRHKSKNKSMWRHVMQRLMQSWNNFLIEWDSCTRPTSLWIWE